MTPQTYYTYGMKPKRRKWPWILLGTVLVMAIGFAIFVNAASDAVEQLDHDLKYGSEEKKAAVTLQGCAVTVDEFGLVNVSIPFSIKNTTEDPQSYWAVFGIKDGATRVGEAHGIVNSLPAGQTYKGKADATLNQKPKKLACVLERVD